MLIKPGHQRLDAISILGAVIARDGLRIDAGRTGKPKRHQRHRAEQGIVRLLSVEAPADFLRRARCTSLDDLAIDGHLLGIAVIAHLIISKSYAARGLRAKKDIVDSTSLGSQLGQRNLPNSTLKPCFH